MATITSNATGNWGTGATWVGGIAPVALDKVIIANGHTVTVDGVYSSGDDTTTALTINGVLKASRTVSSTLTIRGGIVSTQSISTGSPAGIDYGTSSDPIPSGFVAQFIFNDSASPASAKYSISFNNGAFFKAYGAAKKSWTRIGAGVAAAATTISVPDATGWVANDWLYLASTTNNSSSATDYVQVVSVTGAGPYTVTVTPALSFAHAISAPVANMTRNVRFLPSNIAFGCSILLGYLALSNANINTYLAGRYQFGYAEFYCMGSTALGGNTGVDPVTIGGNDNQSVTVAPLLTVIGVSCHNPKTGTVTSGSGSIMPYGMGAVNAIAMQDCVSTARNTSALQIKYGASIQVTNHCTPYAPGVAALALDGTMGPIDSTVSGSYFGGGGYGLLANVGIQNIISNCDFGPTSAAWAIPGFGGPLVIDNCRIGVGAGNATSTALLQFTGASASGVVGDITISNSSIQSYTRSQAHTGDAAMSPQTLIKLYTNSSADDYYQVRYTHDTYADTTTVNRGARSIKVMPYKASTPCITTIAIPASAGISVTVTGYIQLNASYGATPITATLSGLSSTPATFTSATTASVWQLFTLTVTPATTGTLTLTVTGVSTDKTNSAYWIDGIYNDPFTPSCRHYGYTYDPTNPARTTNPVTQLSESAAAALTGISYSAGTLTISSAHTMREVYDWMQWYECSNRLAPILTSSDGVAFTLAANLVLSAALTGSGALAMAGYTLTNTGTSTVSITHNAGVLTSISVTGLVADSRIQLVDMSTLTELYNGSPGTALSLNVNWSTNRILRLRVGYAVGTSAMLPIETTGILSSTGASFLVNQVADTVYNALAIDGGTCTEFTPDYPNLQIDLSDGDGTTNVQRLYAWAAWSQTSALGLASMFQGVRAVDASNFVIDVGVVNARLDNVSGVPVIVGGGYLSRSDGTTVIAPTSGSIQMDPGRAYVAVDIAANVLNVAKLHGLVTGSPLVVTPTSRSAGTLVQTISTVGDTTTVTTV